MEIRGHSIFILEICFLITSVENRVTVEVHKKYNQKSHQWLVEISSQAPIIFLCRQILGPGQVKVAWKDVQAVI